MGKPRVLAGQTTFTGGLNADADPFLVGETQVRACTNGRLSPYGAITKRGGLQRISSAVVAAAPILRGFSWAPTGTATPTELVVCNGRLYSTTYAIPATWTDEGAVSVSVDMPGFAAFRNNAGEVAFIATGDTLYTLDTVGALADVTADGFTPPAGLAALCVYNQRLFGILAAAESATLYWSALNDGRSLGSTGGGEAVIRTFGDRGLTGLAAVGTSLLIWHTSGISRFTGTSQDDIAIAAGAQGITGDVGTQSHGSIVVVDNLAYFMSERGAYVATEGGVQALDRPESPDPTISVMTAMSIANQRLVTATHHRARQEIWWSLPGAGIYVFNYRLGAWSGPFTGGFTGTATRALWDTIDGDGKPIVLVGDQSGWVKRAEPTGVYKDDVLSDGTGGTAVTLTVQGRRLFADSPDQSKAFRFAHVYANLGGATADCTLALDATTGDETLTFPATAVTPYTFRLGGQGPFVDWTFTHAAATSASLSRVSLEAFVLGRRVA